MMMDERPESSNDDDGDPIEGAGVKSMEEDPGSTKRAGSGDTRRPADGSGDTR